MEHFRPKSEIKTGDNQSLKPGYWWLGGTWSNLLISCIDCNRRRTHKVPGLARATVLGKKAQFPLADESRRIRDGSSIATEESVRLLLHPVLDDPMMHLTFDEEGLIHPIETDQGPDKKAVASIKVYALQRSHLVEGRLVVLLKMKSYIEQLITQVQIHDHVIGTGGEALSLNQIISLKRNIEDLLGPGKPYQGMLREFISREKAQGKLALLQQAGMDLEALF